MSNTPINRSRSKTIRDLSVPCTEVNHDISYEWGTPGDPSTVYGTETLYSAPDGQSMDFESKHMTDVVIPRFKQRSAKGEIFNNPCVITRTEYLDVLCDRRRAVLNAIAPYSGDPSTTMPVGHIYDGKRPSSKYILTVPSALTFAHVPEIDVSALQQLAVTGSHANVDFSEASLYETFGEMDETIKFMRHAFIRAIRIFRAVKRWDLKYLRREIRLKELQDRYMECRYAIRPLVYDVRNASRAIQAGSLSTNRFTFRKSETESITDRQTYTGGDGRFEFMKNSKHTVKCSAGVLVELNELSKIQIWGLDQPVEALWELTPFSFIADWFFNIGQTISAHTPNPGVKQLASWITTVEELSCEIVGSPVSIVYDTGSYLYENSFFCTRTLVSKKVTTISRTPNPSLSIMPQFKLKLNTFKLFDLAIIGKCLFSKDRDKALKMAMYKRS